MKWATFFSMVLVLFGLIVSATAQTKSINLQRLKRDLRIMEGILDKLLVQDQSFFALNGKTKGIYLQGYGIIFHRSQQKPIIRIMNTRLNREMEKLRAREESIRQHRERIKEEVLTREKALEDRYDDKEHEDLVEVSGLDVAVVPDFITANPDSIIMEEAQTIEQFKQNLFDFFQDYTPAIGQLNPEDRIAVLLNLKDWELVERENGFLTGWITRQDLNTYRRNQLSQSDFYDRIHFNITQSDSDIDRDIDIMAEILNRAMGTNGYRGITPPSGIYLDGLGALFFIEMPEIYLYSLAEGHDVSIVFQDQVREAITHAYGVPARKAKSLPEKSRKEDIQEMQDTLFDLLASYGHTLRLKPDESIVFNTNLGHRFIRLKDSEPSKLILQLKKKYLDDYNQGHLSIEDLRKQLITQTF